MKKLLAVLAAVTVLVPAAPLMRGQDISVNFFYDNLDRGSWLEVGDYGYCWQPDVAVNDPTWRPYADGYWAYTDDGWTWVSYEDFGWATYHYGRWVRLADYGWVWKPGYEWAPAWVSWRTGGNYIGWAPLPPETEYVYESRPLTGHLDVEFDIGPTYYNFCDVRYIGEPVLRSRLVPYQQNVTYITQTVNVTNITYKNKTVYNYGPDVNVVNQYSSRPIQRLKLERQANVDVSAAAKSGGLTKVQGNALVVAAPAKLNKPAREIAPPTVKTKVAQPKIEKGWSAVGDANAQTQLKEKIKTQDLNKVPPFTTGAAAKTSAAPNASPGMSAAAGPESPFGNVKGKGKNKNKMGDQMPATSPGMATSPGASPAFPEGGKKKWKHPENQPGAMTAPSVAPGAEMSPGTNPGMPEGGKKKGKRAGQNEPGAMTSPFTVPGAGMSPGTSPGIPEGGKQRGKRAGQNEPGAMTSPYSGTGAEMSPGGMPETGKPGKGNKNRRPEQFGATPAPTGPMPETTNAPERKRKEKAQNLGMPAGGTTPQSVTDQPTGPEPVKKRIPDRVPPPGPPLNSRTGAPGGPSTSDMAPQGGPAAGGEARGKHKMEPANAPGAVEPAGPNQPGGERKHEGKGKAPAGTPTPGQP